MEAKAHQPSSPGTSVRFFSDAQLLSQCRIDQYRGSGPGGQKRNKTSNAVRLTHLPTGIQATATESRSLAENKLYVLRRLRLKLAIELREAIDPVKFEPPDWLLAIRTPSRIDISHRHPHYVAAAGLILDLLKVMGGNPGHVAKMLGVSTTAVIKFLETEPQLWAAANSICKELDRPSLQHRN